MTSRLEDVIFKSELNQNWHMQVSERAALMHVLSALKPEISIEIGTFQAGSLRPISAASKRVYTFDINSDHHRYGSDFPNVKFCTGDSSKLLSPVIDEINRGDEELNFVLVDGAHDEIGVRMDLLQCLKYLPKQKPTVILAHDSCNPPVRNAILGLNWESYPYVHSVNIDFVPGMLYNRADINGQMWGGLAAITLLPTPRDGSVIFEASFQHSYETLLAQSVHDERLI